MTIVKKKSKPGGTPVPFIPVEQLPSVLAVLFYGRSGTGKTTIASSFPAPSLLLDIREKGTDSVSNVKGLKVAHLNAWEQFEEIYWYLKKGEHDFKTVIVDQITQLQELAMKKALKDDGKEDTEQMSKRNFGQAGGMMKTWLLNYRDLIDDGIHVVFIAHDRVTNQGDDGSGEDQIDPVVGAALMPSVASFVNGAVKIIGNTFIRETYSIQNKRKVRAVEYSMRIGPHAFYTTKTRSPVGIAAPSVIVDPTYEKLVGIMRGDYSETPTTIRKKR